MESLSHDMIVRMTIKVNSTCWIAIISVGTEILLVQF